MKYLFRILLFLFIVLSTFALPFSSAHAFVDRGEVVSKTFPNGLEVIIREDQRQNVVELQVWVGVGSRDEPRGKEGIAHLFEHMLFKGTEKRGVGEIASEVEAAGGDINAYTSMDHTVYHITIAREYAGVAMEILADAIWHSTFDSDELEREKLVVVEEIHRGNDDPSRVFSRELFKTAYKSHPYGRTVIGTPESVGSIKRKDMVDFHKTWYVPENMKLLVVGGIGSQDIFEKAARLFGETGKNKPEREKVVEPEQHGIRSFSLTMDSDPARVSIAFPIGKLTDPDTPVLDLAAAILSGGRSARFPVQLRDKGIVLNAWAYAYTPADPGLFIVGAAATQDKVEAASRGLLEQISRLQTEDISLEELNLAREQIINDKIFSRETVQGQAREMGYLALTLGDLRFNDTYYSRLQSVEPGDIRDVARRVFRPERATIGFLTREAGSQPDEDTTARLLTEVLKPAQQTESRVPASVYRSRLPNGITLLVREDRGLPLVSVRAGVLGGTRYETEVTQGSYNLLAHLLTRGTHKRSAQELARKLDGMSASISGFSGRNSLGVTGKFLSRDIQEGFSLLREVLTGATLPQTEVDLFKAQIQNAIKAQKDNMTFFALEIFTRTLFKEHPYRFPVMGTVDSVDNITRQDLLSIYRSTIQPEGMVISVSGDISVKNAYRMVQENFGDLEGEPYDPGPLPVEVASKGVVSERVSREDKAQSHVILGYPGPALDAPDLDALEVLNAVLAGQSGRLFKELRDKESLAYSVFSFVAPGIDPGYIAFGIGVDPARESEAVSGFLEQIRRVRGEYITDEELERAKMFLVGSHMIRLQTLQSRADEVFFPALYGQDLDHALAFDKRIRSVTAWQVRQAALKYLDPENYTIAVVQGGGRGEHDAETPFDGLRAQR
jgi:zinc protease